MHSTDIVTQDELAAPPCAVWAGVLELVVLCLLLLEFAQLSVLKLMLLLRRRSTRCRSIRCRSTHRSSRWPSSSVAARSACRSVPGGPQSLVRGQVCRRAGCSSTSAPEPGRLCWLPRCSLTTALRGAWEWSCCHPSSRSRASSRKLGSAGDPSTRCSAMLRFRDA